MTRSPRSSMTWLLISLGALVLVALDLPNHLLTHVAYAVQRGRIQASSEELAKPHEVAHLFRLVAQVARPGVVNIQASPGEREQQQWDDLKRREKELKRRRDELEKLLGGDNDSDVDREAVWKLLSELRELEREREQLHSRLVPGTGSGIVYDRQGHILTNNHVVDARSEIKVQLADQREFPATLVGADPESDIALLKINASDLHPLEFGDSDQMQVGDWVLAVGAPFGLSQSVTHGIVSARGRTNINTGEREIVYQDFIQTDAAINPGNSGGPLLNLQGQVIGINTAIATNGDSYNAGIAFSIPSNLAVKIAEKLKTTGQVARGWLGVTMGSLAREDRELFGLERDAVLISSVLGGSPAEAAGFHVEDIVLAINGHPVRSNAEMLAVIGDIFPGERAEFDIVRGRKPMHVSATLGRRPADVRAARLNTKMIDAIDLPILGASVRTLLPSVAELNGFDKGDHGAFVVAIDGPDADLRAGDLVLSVGTHQVATAVSLQQRLENLGTRKRITLRVKRRDGQTHTIYVKPHAQ